MTKIDQKDDQDDQFRLQAIVKMTKITKKFVGRLKASLKSTLKSTLHVLVITLAVFNDENLLDYFLTSAYVLDVFIHISGLFGL